MVHLAVPGFDAGRSILAHPDIVVHAVTAVFVPDVRVQRVVDRDVVVNMAVESFTKLEATLEHQVVVDFIVGGAVIEVDIPAVITAPAAVADDGFFRIQLGELG